MKWTCLLLTVLLHQFVDLSAADSGCHQKPELPIEVCPEMLLPNTKYRPVDGKVVNRCRNKGQSFHAYERFLNPHYSDCVWDLGKTKNSHSELPLARNITVNVLTPFRRVLTPGVRAPSFLSAMIGQFIGHDIGSRQNRVLGVACCNADRTEELPKATRNESCLPFVLPPGDRDFGVFAPSVCFSGQWRSSITVETTDQKWPIDQVNEVTAFLDNSNLYGSEEFVMASLRAGLGGRMLTNAENILPERGNQFFLGDARMNQTPQLALIHSIFLREHNRIAGELDNLNPHWSDETLFQEARRINIAEFQHIVYEEFLATHLAPSVKQLVDISVHIEHLEAVTYNEVNQAVFRNFHAFLPTDLKIIAADGSFFIKTLKEMTISGTFTFLPAYYDDIARGLLLQPIPIEEIDLGVMHGLFALVGRPGADLLAGDILRGRDHGLPPYVNVLKITHPLSSFNTFDALSLFMTEGHIQLLRENYESVEDIDLFVGCLLETPLPGTLFGPTSQMMFATQFIRLKTADPWFYTNPHSPKPFTKAQLNEIKKASTNSLFCLNSRVTQVPRDLMIAPITADDFIDCSTVPRMSYLAWKE